MQTQSLSSQETNLNWELATKLFNKAKHLVLFHYLFLQSNHANPVSGEWSMHDCKSVLWLHSRTLSAIKGIMLHKRGTLGWWKVLRLGWLLIQLNPKLISEPWSASIVLLELDLGMQVAKFCFTLLFYFYVFLLFYFFWKLGRQWWRTSKMTTRRIHR